MAALLAQRMDLITAMVYTFEEEGLQEGYGRAAALAPADGRSHKFLPNLTLLRNYWKIFFRVFHYDLPSSSGHRSVGTGSASRGTPQ
jgi:hypothetical protein